METVITDEVSAVSHFNGCDFWSAVLSCSDSTVHRSGRGGVCLLFSLFERDNHPIAVRQEDLELMRKSAMIQQCRLRDCVSCLEPLFFVRPTIS